jgi:hypothetical protein
MSELGAVAFGEKVLAMLDQGAFTATYKYAVLLALLDVCLEGADAEGAAPDAVHPRMLAARVVELYWPQTSLYGGGPDEPPVVLRQNRGGQAEIVTLVRRFRDRVDAGGHAPLSRARRADPAGYERLVRDVTWKLVEMPLPRLQRFGRAEDRFLYELAWDERVSRRQFEAGVVDPWLRLQPGVGDHLVRLAGLLRPLIQRQWAVHVVALNRAEVAGLREQGELDAFLFGVARTDLSPVRPDLVELQDGVCFYCGDRLRRTADVDHFLPWVRHPDDGIHNLVAAHPGCNNRKRDFLAAAPHVARWTQRFNDAGYAAALATIAEARRWACHPDRTLAVARAVYLRLPHDARLWLARDEFVTPDRARLSTVLAAPLLAAAAESRPPYEPDLDTGPS